MENTIGHKQIIHGMTASCPFCDCVRVSSADGIAKYGCYFEMKVYLIRKKDRRSLGHVPKESDSTFEVTVRETCINTMTGMPLYILEDSLGVI